MQPPLSLPCDDTSVPLSRLAASSTRSWPLRSCAATFAAVLVSRFRTFSREEDAFLASLPTGSVLILTEVVQQKCFGECFTVGVLRISRKNINAYHHRQNCNPFVFIVRVVMDGVESTLNTSVTIVSTKCEKRDERTAPDGLRCRPPTFSAVVDPRRATTPPSLHQAAHVAASFAKVRPGPE